MKNLLVGLLFFSAVSAGAAKQPDFAGCIQYNDEGQPYYQITKNGKLSGAQKSKGLVDTYSKGDHKVVLERDAETKLPVRLTSTYRGKTTTRVFRYDAQRRCLLDQVTSGKAKASPSAKAAVTYDHDLCEQVQDWYNEHKFQISRCGKEFEAIGQKLAEFNQKFNQKGKELAGYTSSAFKTNPFGTSLNVAYGCQKARESYDYPYVNRVGAFDAGIFEFRGIPENEATGPTPSSSDAK